MQLQVQAHVNHRELSPETFRPVSNEPVATDDESKRCKPSGGLWTSTAQPEHFSAYGRNWKSAVIAICRERAIRDFPHDVWIAPSLKVWHLKPNPAARIAVVDSLNDFSILGQKYGWVNYQYKRTAKESRYSSSPTVTCRSLNYEAIAEDYDAIHLTERGWSQDKEGDMMGMWHSESTVWLRWMFDEIEYKGLFWPDFPKKWHDESVYHMRVINGMSTRGQIYIDHRSLVRW